jgi:hypothetical protein
MWKAHAWIVIAAIGVVGCYPLAPAKPGTTVACYSGYSDCSGYGDAVDACSTRAPAGFYWEQLPVQESDDDILTCSYVLRAASEKTVVGTAEAPSSGTAPAGCATDAECKGNRSCSNGRCEPRASSVSTPGCVRDIDCPGDSVCDDGRCQPPTP